MNWQFEKKAIPITVRPGADRYISCLTIAVEMLKELGVRDGNPARYVDEYKRLVDKFVRIDDQDK